MKRLFIYTALLTAAFTACDPIENRDEMTGAITADQLQISATPVVVNGKNSNKIILENNSPCLTLWDYGLGTSTRAYQEVLLVLPGENTIKFTGLNADGTTITKELTVKVDELSFEVPKEWALFCGTGVKTWTWEDSAPCYGNGGYLSNVAPGWWLVNVDDVGGQVPGEGKGAELIFSTAGSKLTKKRTDGTTEAGTFSFDMSKTTNDAGGTNLWGIGKLATKNVTILVAKSPDSSEGAPLELDILKLTDAQMALSYAPAGTGAWGTAHYWVFKAK